MPGRYLDIHLSSNARQIADHQQQQNTATHQQQQDKAASHHHTPEHQTPLVQGLQGSLGDGQGEYARSEFRDEISDTESCSHGASLACAFHLKYKNTCVHCQASRGHRRAHYKIPRDQISTGVISFDLSGPHDKARDGTRYFLVGVLVNKEPTSVPYVRVQKSKKAVETLAGIKSILAQIRAEADNPEVVIRVHSDGGGEFTAANVVDEVAREGFWKTLSAAYEPEANGKAERQVQVVKEAATSLLLHADMPKSFWSYAVKQAAYELRLQALNIDRPVGTPTFGDPVGVRIQAPDPFSPRVREGVYLCVNEAIQDATQVLVDGNQGLQIVTTRLPAPFEVAPKRWRKLLSPDEALAVWVAEDGTVRWTEPDVDEVVTLEERQDGPDPAEHEVAGRFEAIKRQVRDSSAEAALSPFAGRGCQMNTFSKAAVATHAEPNGKTDKQDGKYLHLSMSAEQEIEDAERMAAILAE